MDSLSPTGIRAAVRADLATTVMPVASLERDYRILGKQEGLPALERIRIVSYSDPEQTSALCRDFISLATKAFYAVKVVGKFRSILSEQIAQGSKNGKTGSGLALPDALEYFFAPGALPVWQ